MKQAVPTNAAAYPKNSNKTSFKSRFRNGKQLLYYHFVFLKVGKTEEITKYNVFGANLHKHHMWTSRIAVKGSQPVCFVLC